MERAENFEMEDLLEDMITNLELQHEEASFSEVGPMINNLSTLDMTKIVVWENFNQSKI